MIARFVASSFAFLGLLAGSPASAAGTVFVDAGRGPVAVRVPSSYDPNVPAPLFVLLHGYTSSGAATEAYLQLASLADQRGFLYVTPNGTVDSGGNPFWNATPACCDFDSSGVDDSAYLRDLMDAVKSVLAVDPTRVYVGGHSNGGFMSYRMACDHAETIAAIASLAGATFANAAACVPSHPVHALQIHGTNDTVIQFNGGAIGGVPYPSALGSAQTWAAYGGCDIASTSGAPLDLDVTLPGAETTVQRFDDNCTAGGSSELWTIVGGTHVPFLGATFRTELMDWLEAHPKPALGVSYCTSTLNSSGFRARIAVTGSDAIADEQLTLIASGAPAFVPGLFIAGQVQNQVPFGDGFLCVGPPLVRLPPTVGTTAGGEAFFDVDFQAPYAQVLFAAIDVDFQFWFRDVPGGAAGFNLSDARHVTLTP